MKKHVHLPLNARRFRSYLIDTIVVCLIVAIPVMLLGTVDHNVAGRIVGGIVWLGPIYAFFRDSIGGASIGKRYYGIRVVKKENQEPAGFFAALLRNAVMYIPFIGFIDLAVLLFDPHAQRISDRILRYEVLIVD